jgi:hypothetical protein
MLEERVFVKNLVFNKLVEMGVFYSKQLFSDDLNDDIKVKAELSNIHYMIDYILLDKIKPDELTSFLLNQSRCNGRPCVSLGLA